MGLGQEDSPLSDKVKLVALADMLDLCSHPVPYAHNSGATCAAEGIENFSGQEGRAIVT